MRGWWALLALALVVPVPAAGDVGLPTDIVTDPEGDVQTGGVADADTSFMAADLLALAASVGGQAIHWTVTVAGLQSDAPVLTSIDYVLVFKVDTVTYRIHIERNVPLPSVSAGIGAIFYRSEVAVYDDSIDAFRGIAEPPVDVDADAGSMTVATPLALLVDATGLPARDQSEFRDLVVTTSHFLQGLTRTPLPRGGTADGVPQITSDRMPDAGVVTYLLEIVPTSDRQILLQSPDPIRATNGGPGTFVFPLLATNLGDDEADVVPSLEGLPPGWSASVVDALLQVGGHETRSTSVVVQPPFAHRHGSVVNLTVKALNHDGKAIANEVLLQLYYSEPPQPSGHHPQLYIHSFQPEQFGTPVYDALFEPALGWNTRVAYMNANPEDDRDTRQSVNVGSTGLRIPMGPSLGMGLDFDLAQPGVFTASFASTTTGVDLTDVTFSAQLLLVTPHGETVLAESPTTAPMTLTGTPVDVRLPLSMSLASDYVPYRPDTNLVLNVAATFSDATSRGVAAPDLKAGAVLTLPFLEYQDLVPLQSVGDLQVNVRERLKAANPGDQVVFDVDLRNAGDAPLDATLAPLAVSGEGIRSIRPAEHRIAGGKTAVSQVEIVVPDVGSENDVFAYYIAIRTSDSEQATLVRLAVDVTTEQDVDSDQIAKASRGAPGVSPGVALGLLGLLALVQPRRRS